MDRTDKKILQLLQHDASIRNIELADKVGLAPSSCLRRVKNLWSTGVIKRSVVLTDAEKMGKSLKAIVNVKLADHGLEARKKWIGFIKNNTAVSQAYLVSGEEDIIVFLTLINMKEFQRISEEIFEKDDNIVQYITRFILDEIKFDPGH